ncbi:MAG: helix-turn-helix domain-containing protein [Opitutaceae bacterium]|jgi:HTH-type transcriptional regulator/antitoxin HigA
MDWIPMKITSTALKFSAVPKTYAGLVAWHVPRPIHDRASYDNAVEIIHALAGFKLNRDQDDYLELMAKLIEDYERETIPEPKPVKGIAALKFLLEENGLSGDDLGRIIGVDRSIAYRILKGARNLTAGHIKKLSARFAVSADLFLM